MTVIQLQQESNVDLTPLFFKRLLSHPKWDQIDAMGEGYSKYVEYEGGKAPNRLAFYALQVFWQLVTEGILAPGNSGQSPSLPWFHITEYGKTVVQSGECNPHDPSGYLVRIRQKVANVDDTAVAYLVESLNGLRRGLPVASTIMLGIAAERVFILVCESLLDALSEPNEKKKFKKVLERYVMKPKLDWVHNKFREVQGKKINSFPDNASLMITAIYDLIRCQRNELGHPRATPPNVTKEDAFVDLQIFPRYYEIAEVVRRFFAANKV